MDRARRAPGLRVLLCAVIAGAFVAVGQLLGRVPALVNSWWGGLAAELIMGALAALGLLACRKGRVLTAGGRGFPAGLAAGGFLLAVTVLAMAGQLAQWDAEPVGELDVFYFTAYMFAIGLAEELLFRGLIQNLLADAFGRDTGRGVWLTVAVSGCLFGAVHLSNILAGVSPLGAFVQAVTAGAIGMYLGAVYVRCGNIWVLVFLHGLNDMAGLMGQTSAVEAVSAYGPEKLVAVVLYIGLTAFLLRPKKMDGILEKSGPA